MNNAKKVPEGAGAGAIGPYSPVLEVKASKIVVISGQIPTTADGKVFGADIAEQTRLVLDKCARQLEYAGCSLGDVFKTTVFMANMEDWAKMNEVYKEMMPSPFPTRTCVGAQLLPGVLVEIEMWAARA